MVREMEAEVLCIILCDESLSYNPIATAAGDQLLFHCSCTLSSRAPGGGHPPYRVTALWACSVKPASFSRFVQHCAPIQSIKKKYIENIVYVMAIV